MKTKTLPPGPMSKSDHIDMLKRAIGANLAARVDHDRRQERARSRRNEEPKIEAICAADLMKADDNWLELDSIIKDPVRNALREQLRDLGQRLFEVLGGTSEMVDIATDIANLDRKHWGHRINIIDKAWDGVGNKTDIWVS
jgi:hypothetical protein